MRPPAPYSSDSSFQPLREGQNDADVWNKRSESRDAKVAIAVAIAI